MGFESGSKTASVLCLIPWTDVLNLNFPRASSCDQRYQLIIQISGILTTQAGSPRTFGGEKGKSKAIASSSYYGMGVSFLCFVSSAFNSLNYA